MIKYTTVPYLIASTNSSEHDKKVAKYIFGQVGGKGITNAELETLINDNITNGATEPFNGLYFKFLNGTFDGINLKLNGRASYNNAGKIKIEGSSGTFFGSSSSSNDLPCFLLSNALQIDIDNIRFKLRNGNKAIQTTVEPSYRSPIIGLTITGGVITGATVIDGGKGIDTATIQTRIIDDYGTGTGAVIALTYTAGVATGVSVTSGGTGYSNQTKVYFHSGFVQKTGTSRRAVWNSSFTNLYVEGIGTHNSYAFDFGSLFRSTIENIEIFNTKSGIKFSAEQSNFNPGNLIIGRVFHDAGSSNAIDSVSYHISSNGSDNGQGRMNIISMTECDSYLGPIHGGTALLIDGANRDGCQDITYNIGNFEQFTKAIQIDAGKVNHFTQISYAIQKTSSVGVDSWFNFGKLAHNNVLNQVNIPLFFGGVATTVKLLNDCNTSNLATNTINYADVQTTQANVTLDITNQNGNIGTTKFENTNIAILNSTTKLVDDTATYNYLMSTTTQFVPIQLKTRMYQQEVLAEVFFDALAPVNTVTPLFTVPTGNKYSNLELQLTCVQASGTNTVQPQITLGSNNTGVIANDFNNLLTATAITQLSVDNGVNFLATGGSRSISSTAPNNVITIKLSTQATGNTALRYRAILKGSKR